MQNPFCWKWGIYSKFKKIVWLALKIQKSVAKIRLMYRRRNVHDRVQRRADRNRDPNRYRESVKPSYDRTDESRYLNREHQDPQRKFKNRRSTGTNHIRSIRESRLFRHCVVPLLQKPGLRNQSMPETLIQPCAAGKLCRPLERSEPSLSRPIFNASGKMCRSNCDQRGETQIGIH